MNYKTKEDIMNRLKEQYAEVEAMGYEIVGLFLQGSWNYGEGMSDEQSDIDSKCIILPTFEDICLNKQPVSHTHVCKNNEHIDLKDLRLYINCFKKQNINFMEILFTDYCIINPKYAHIFNELISHREEIGRYDIKAALNCICGMAYEKQKALCHPYPGIKDKIEKYGFDGKQLSHILRLHHFIWDYAVKELPYEECLICKNAERITEIKRNKHIRLAQAKELADIYTEEINKIRASYLNLHAIELTKSKEVENLFNRVVVECLKIKFIGDINE